MFQPMFRSIRRSWGWKRGRFRSSRSRPFVCSFIELLFARASSSSRFAALSSNFLPARNSLEIPRSKMLFASHSSCHCTCIWDTREKASQTRLEFSAANSNLDSEARLDLDNRVCVQFEGVWLRGWFLEKKKDESFSLCPEFYIEGVE